jgi:hypothetical protein
MEWGWRDASQWWHQVVDNKTYDNEVYDHGGGVLVAPPA